MLYFPIFRHQILKFCYFQKVLFVYFVFVDQIKNLPIMPIVHLDRFHSRKILYHAPNEDGGYVAFQNNYPKTSCKNYSCNAHGRNAACQMFSKLKLYFIEIIFLDVDFIANKIKLNAFAAICLFHSITVQTRHFLFECKLVYTNEAGLYLSSIRS